MSGARPSRIDAARERAEDALAAYGKIPVGDAKAHHAAHVETVAALRLAIEALGVAEVTLRRIAALPCRRRSLGWPTSCASFGDAPCGPCIAAAFVAELEEGR